MCLGAMSAQGWAERKLEAKGRVKDHVVEFAEVKTMRVSYWSSSSNLSVPLS